MHSFHIIPRVPSLITFCSTGLCNRLRVLTSSLALAEASGRSLQMLWPTSSECTASFQSLFTNDWPVIDRRPHQLPHADRIRTYDDHEIPDLLTSDEAELYVGAYSWLLQPIQFAHHTAAFKRTQEIFRQLRPTPAIQHAVDDFRNAHFRSRMIGVHLRRGDFMHLRPDLSGNTPEAFAEIDRILSLDPDAGILLCSDDNAEAPPSKPAPLREGLHDKFLARYGDRVVWTTPHTGPKRFTRDSEHALIDLWLLRSTDYFIGTPWSSFSELVAFARDVPSVLVSGGTPKYRRTERLLRYTGMLALLHAINRRQRGRDEPTPFILQRWKQHFLQLLRRQ